MRIGVLALQDAFIEHMDILTRLGVEAVEIRLPKALKEIDGLIIPGGESTTISRLAVMYDLLEPLQVYASIHPVWGTCAGMIFMANEADLDQPLLNVMNIAVKRNAFGRQVNSFLTDLKVSVLKDGERRPFPAVFIRAPKIIAAKGKAKIIAKLSDGTAVAAQEEKRLVTAFHPELTNDDRFHRYFLSLIGI